MTAWLAEHQVDFVPYGGVFAKALLANEFVLCDDLPASRTKSFGKRNKLRNKDGWQWVTVPVRSWSAPVRDVIVKNGREWFDTKFSRSVRLLYARTPFPDRLEELLIRPVAFGESPSLFEINAMLFLQCLEMIDLEAVMRVRFATSLRKTDSIRDEESLARMRELGCWGYLTGEGALAYLDVERFLRTGFKPTLVKFTPRPYKQMFPGWEPNMSIVDILLCVEDVKQYLYDCTTVLDVRIRKGEIEWKEPE